jgi:hypothetical protein
MRLYTERIFIIAGVALIAMIGFFSVSGAYADDNITMQKLIGIWWTHDADQVPWAIQFNEDGTFRSAHTYLRLETVPKDEGQFQLKGTSLTLISNSDCEGSCKGLEGRYEVEFTEYGQLVLKEQQDQCSKRKEVCRAPWIKALR